MNVALVLKSVLPLIGNSLEVPLCLFELDTQKFEKRQERNVSMMGLSVFAKMLDDFYTRLVALDDGLMENVTDYSDHLVKVSMDFVQSSEDDSSLSVKEKQKNKKSVEETLRKVTENEESATKEMTRILSYQIKKTEGMILRVKKLQKIFPND
ncbi:MAG: hypothetical protein KBC41_02150 [Candidatus Pacebacteria bacterium]|nr:hypothetical protein [Candidatus Paceibacterota bacterium]MBP9866857.1 hypothetical protein [Candidatus Paceibacterota bacterium]